MVFDRERFIGQVREAVCASFDITEDPRDDEILNQVRDAVFFKAREYSLTVGEKKEIVDRVFNSLRRLDVLQPLLEDESITEIMINGPDTIFIEQNGGMRKLNKRFESKEKLENIIQSIVSTVNRAVNESSPIVDARLKDGSRVSVVLPPVALNGPILTIRKFSREPMTMDRLIRYGSLTPEIAEYLKMLVRAKYNIFVCGGTGSGKTTMLNALSNFIPGDERVITVEDSAELQIVNVPNIISMETRDANTEGRGQISIRELIRASLRMRPDRLVVGEVRGPEAIDMLQAMNTGHDGSLSTGHANSTRDMLSRIETMVLSGAPLPIDAVRKQMTSALDIIIHLGRLRDRSRKVLEISEVLNCVDGEIQINTLFQFKETGETDGSIKGNLESTGNSIKNILKLQRAGLRSYDSEAPILRQEGE